MLAAWVLPAFAQTEPYNFKEYARMKVTPVKSQDQTGTCWAFSTMSFLESEALRLGKKDQDLSEMFIVRNIYRMKCENYVRRQGHAQFGEGGLAHDALNATARFGLMPESAYPGRKDPKAPFNHSKIEKTLKNLCDEFVKMGQDGNLPTDWLVRIDAALDEEFGPVPVKFTLGNVQYTPITYRDYLNIHPEDYVTITSFTHHPYWEKFILEIPDNWANGQMYNMPISDLMRCVKSSVDLGYSVEWDTDVSNDGFSAPNGVAIVPAKGWKEKDATAQANTFKMWEPETKVTQESRQQLFDRQVTTDDHLMHIVGMLEEKHSGLYYVVKNSWGEISDNKGFVYCSDAYLRQNTLSFTVHKDVIPADLIHRFGSVTEAQSMDATGEKPKPEHPAGLELKPNPNMRNSKPNPAQPGAAPAPKNLKGGAVDH